MPEINTRMTDAQVVNSRATLRDTLNSKLLDIHVTVEFPDPEPPDPDPPDVPDPVGAEFNADFNNDWA